MDDRLTHYPERKPGLTSAAQAALLYMPADQNPLSSEQWFTRGEYFLRAGMLLHGAESGFGPPIVVLLAFATEAFLKCLLTLEKGASVWGHDLPGLFEQLSPESQGVIRTEWEKVNPPLPEEHPFGDQIVLPRTFEERLSFCPEPFVAWRYGSEEPMAWFVNDLPEHVRNRIFEFRPEWKDKPPHAFP